MTLPLATACAVCGATELDDVVELGPLPVFCNVLYDDEQTARGAPLGLITLAVCRACSLLQNRSFDPDLAAYAPGYENSLHFSPTFQRFSDELAARLVARYDLHGKTVVEIGAGGGDFLRSVCELGANRGIGFDPSHDPTRHHPGPVQVVTAPFPEDGAVGADLVCARHVLEHLETPLPLVRSVGRALAQRAGSVFYAEVPDAGYMLEHRAVWDVIYEHCTYFTRPALAHLVARGGMRVVDDGVAFGGQYLWAEAVADADSEAPSLDAAALVALAADFGRDVAGVLASWQHRLQSLVERGPVAVWGAGSKGVTFLNALPSGRDVRWVIDVNPRKHGRFVPGTAQMVAPPSAMWAVPPVAVVVMNPMYVAEIEAMLVDLGLADALVVGVTT